MVIDMTVNEAKSQLEVVKIRLKNYIDRETEMLTGGVQSYGVGTRNATRYNTELSQIRAGISELEKKKAELESIINGGSKRRAMGIVPRDW